MCLSMAIRREKGLREKVQKLEDNVDILFEQKKNKHKIFQKV